MQKNIRPHSCNFRVCELHQRGTTEEKISHNQLKFPISSLFGQKKHEGENFSKHVFGSKLAESPLRLNQKKSPRFSKKLIGSWHEICWIKNDKEQESKNMRAMFSVLRS